MSSDCEEGSKCAWESEREIERETERESERDRQTVKEREDSNLYTHSTVQCIILQYSAVHIQYRAAQYSTEQQNEI